VVVSVSAGFAACGSDPEAGALPDASGAPDAATPTDASTVDSSTSDATSDASRDALADALSDAPGDAAVDAPVDTGPARPFRYLFATVPSARASLSSIAAADALCMAAKPSSVAKVKALLVGPTRTACTTADCAVGGAGEHVDWPLAPSTEYRRLDGTTVLGTTNAKGLFDSLRASVDTVDGFVWTGLAANGANTWTSWLTSPSTCAAWASTSGLVLGGAAYRGPSYVNAAFGAFIDACDKSFAIYCAETD
jgi:hypothetical protein